MPDLTRLLKETKIAAEQATAEFREHLREVRSRAKPLRTELVASTDTEWLKGAAVQELTAFLAGCGFQAAGVFEVKNNKKIVVAGFAAPPHGVYASIPKVVGQGFVSFTSDFEDGGVFECSNMPVPFEPPYPDWLIHRRRIGTPAQELWLYFQRERPPKATMDARPTGFVKSSTDSMFRYRAWMAERGGETREEFASRYRAAGKLPAGEEGERLLDSGRNNELEKALCSWWRLQTQAPCPVEQVFDSLVIIHDELQPHYLLAAYWCGTGDFQPQEKDFAQGSPREAFARVVSKRRATLRKVLEKRTPLAADFYLPS
jgi:hypothetical protein